MASSFRVERRPLHNQIAEYLREQIVQGGLKSGAPLPSERDLAARFEVSRNSLRQAIAYLEAMGYVEARHGAGLFVGRPHNEATVTRFADVLLDPRRSLVDVVEGRLAIEPTSARYAAERRTEADVVALRRFTDDVDPESAALRPINFHTCLVEATSNPVLVGIQRALETGPGNVAELLHSFPDARSQWDRAHRDIFVAVQDQDPDASALLMTDHLEHVLALARRFAPEGHGDAVT